MVRERFYQNKRISVVIVLLVIIIIVGLIRVPLKKEIDIKDETSIYQFNNYEYSNPISITIKGTFYRYLFRSDRFVGQVIIDDYPYTENYEMVEIVFRNGTGKLYYENIEDGIIKGNSIGDIIIDKKFENILLLVYEEVVEGRKHWSLYNGLFSVIPSENRAEAFRQAYKISSNSKWLNSGDWSKVK